MYLVIVDVRRTWITDPSDPFGRRIICGSTTSSPAGFIQGGTYRQLAGNRVRGAKRNASFQSYPVTLRALTPDQHELLVSWTGRTLLFRTFEGARLFGSYLTINSKRILNTTGDGSRIVNFRFDDEITFGQTSFDESV